MLLTTDILTTHYCIPNPAQMFSNWMCRFFVPTFNDILASKLKVIKKLKGVSS